MDVRSSHPPYRPSPPEDLPKDLQVGPVEDARRRIFGRLRVLGPWEPLSGHPVGSQPHAEEEEEEEHIPSPAEEDEAKPGRPSLL